MKSPADLTDADAALPHEATLASLRAVSALAGVYAAILALKCRLRSARPILLERLLSSSHSSHPWPGAPRIPLGADRMAFGFFSANMQKTF